MLTIATAIFGPGFRLYDPAETFNGCRFVCFTDQPLKSKAWKIVRQSHKLTPRRSNRHVKTLLHRYVDGPTLYVDSEFRLTKDPREFIEPALEQSCIAATEHPKRSCLFDEADFCLLKKRVESPRLLTEQTQRYVDAGIPRRYGLWAGNIIARRGDHDSDRLGEAWWQEIKHGAERDQVSLPYVCWRLGITPSVIPGTYSKLGWIERKKKKRRYS